MEHWLYMFIYHNRFGPCGINKRLASHFLLKTHGSKTNEQLHGSICGIYTQS